MGWKEIFEVILTFDINIYISIICIYIFMCDSRNVVCMYILLQIYTLIDTF